MKFRVEKDSLGEVEVPFDALFQAQTQRALDNFKFSQRQIPDAIIDAILDIKGFAAKTNARLKLISVEDATAIFNAVVEIKELSFKQNFPLDVFQTGSGTSSHMNVNEVISTVASRLADHKIHPNDIINRGQSSNDVFPSAIQIAVVRETKKSLLPALGELILLLQKLAEMHQKSVKNVRTHLMDATPITFGQEFFCWQQQFRYVSGRLDQVCNELKFLPLGGTAVGTGMNTHPDFASGVCQLLNNQDGLNWQVEPVPATKMSGQEHTLAFASVLKNAAVCLLKIANDLRWMNSGPVSGLGELQLPALQPGSSIMPGKVNPVIPEAIAMIAAEIIGNETSVTIAAQSGNFQLNVMLPLIGEKLIDSVHLLSNAINALNHKVLSELKIHIDKTAKQVALNPVLATALNPHIGYDQAAKIAKRAAKENRTVLEIALEETSLGEDELALILDPLKMI